MRRTWIVLALVTGLVAACSGSATTGSLQASGTSAGGTQAAASATSTGNPTGGAPSAPVACSLITADEAAAALGEPVSPGTAPVPGENTCVFSGPVLKLTSVEIAIIDPAEFTPTQQSVPSDFTVTQVSGIGDAAYYKKLYLPNAGGESLMELSVRKGQTMFTVSIIDHAASDSRLMAAEKTLALAAVGRI